MKKIVLPIIGFIFLISCTNEQDDLKNHLIGLRWEISEMKYKNIDYEPYLIFSSFVFEKEGKCNIPIIRLEKGFINKKDRFAKWTLVDENRISIESVKDYANGVFTICIDKDEKSKSVFIVIESKDLYVKAYRLLGKGFNEPLPKTCDK